MRIQVKRKFAPLLPDPATGVTSIRTRYLILTGGRGSGKSFALSLALAMMLQHRGYTILFCRYTMASAKDSIIPELREKTELMGCQDEYRETVQDVEHRLTGSQVMFRGIKTAAGNQTAKLKSLHGVNVFVLDEAEEMPSESIFDTIDLSVRDQRRPNLVILCLNPAHKIHWIHRRFWEGRGIPDDGFTGAAGDATYIHTTYLDNLAHLPADYLRKAEESRTSGDPARYKSVWMGAWADEVAGALWSWGMISDHRREPSEVPDLKRMVVAVDPNVSYGPDADEAGIAAAGEGVDGHFYVLEDASGRFGPHEWGRVSVQQYRKHKADAILGESNNGGELVRENIEKFTDGDQSIKVEIVNASRGKIPRAEPVATLYSKGLVHHVGRFPELEAEMMSYTGEKGERSPNRMDALVWALTYLAGFESLAPTAALGAGMGTLRNRS